MANVEQAKSDFLLLEAFGQHQSGGEARRTDQIHRAVRLISEVGVLFEIARSSFSSKVFFCFTQVYWSDRNLALSGSYLGGAATFFFV